MIIKARRSKSNVWGFLEKFESYRHYDKGYVKALAAVTMEGKLTPVYVFRGGEFVPLKDIDGEMGLEKYIKAKKPFYSKVKEGYVVQLKARVDYVNRVYIPEESTFEVYVINGAPSNLSDGLPFKKVLNVPKEFEQVVKEPLRLLGESFGDREVFLKSRLS